MQTVDIKKGKFSGRTDVHKCVVKKPLKWTRKAYFYSMSASMTSKFLSTNIL